MSSRINPYKRFIGSFIPEWLEKIPSTEVSVGAKLIYARLCRYAGKNGDCHPGTDEIASATGIPKRSVERYMCELKNIKLIEVVRVGKKCSNRYFFLNHRWISGYAQLQSDAPDWRITDKINTQFGGSYGSANLADPQKENQGRESNIFFNKKNDNREYGGKMAVNIRSPIVNECRYIPENATITDHHLFCHSTATKVLKTDVCEFEMCDTHYREISQREEFTMLNYKYKILR